jgi:hypothetical protein
VRALFKQVQGEVPGSPIFIMKVASQVRTDSKILFPLLPTWGFERIIYSITGDIEREPHGPYGPIIDGPL